MSFILLIFASEIQNNIIMATIELDINIAKTYEGASLEELENARDKYITATAKADLIAKGIYHLIVLRRIELAKEKFPDLKRGDKVEVLYSVGFGTRFLETFFFDGISERAKESLYMSNRPFYNFAIPKKDGTMGKRFRSFPTERVYDIKKVQL